MARSKFEKWVEVVFAFIFFFVSSTMMSVFIRWSVNWNAKDYDSIEAFEKTGILTSFSTPKKYSKMQRATRLE